MKKSAGIILYRRNAAQVEVLLAHPGGPFWANKDDASWSIPKGEFEDESPLDAAIREFEEETGIVLKGDFLELTPVKQPSGKVVFAWACEGDCDPSTVASNTFSMEWPKGSGVMKDFPEIDRVAWFPQGAARRKILKGQIPIIVQLEKVLGVPPAECDPEQESVPAVNSKLEGQQLSFL